MMKSAQSRLDLYIQQAQNQAQQFLGDNHSKTEVITANLWLCVAEWLNHVHIDLFHCNAPGFDSDGNPFHNTDDE